MLKPAASSASGGQTGGGQTGGGQTDGPGIAETFPAGSVEAECLKIGE